MKKRKLVVRLKGGLGNQMFQYAAARSIAEQNDSELILDAHSGFLRDKVYKRTFSLDCFNISDSLATLPDQLPFYLEDIINKYVSDCTPLSEKKRPWGICFKENVIGFHGSVLEKRTDCNLWLDGFWQSELYFKSISSDIAHTFKLDAPNEKSFISLVNKLQQENAIAVGIRLYEEAPQGAHNPSPFSFYEQAANQLAQKIDSPKFYLFCTKRQLIEGKLNLPGEIEYVTHDDGYDGTLNRLWLLSQFRYHIMSHSSFYWWGTWLAEQNRPNVEVIAHNLFDYMIPKRWQRL